MSLYHKPLKIFHLPLILKEITAAKQQPNRRSP